MEEPIPDENLPDHIALVEVVDQGDRAQVREMADAGTRIVYVLTVGDIENLYNGGASQDVPKVKFRELPLWRRLDLIDGVKNAFDHTDMEWAETMREGFDSVRENWDADKEPGEESDY